MQSPHVGLSSTSRVANSGIAARQIPSFISVVGASTTPEPPIERNLKVERAFYILEGQPVARDSATGGTAQLQQTDRRVVGLKVAASAGGRLLLVDRLPAGLEIDNPQLFESGDLRNFAWLNTTVRPEPTKFRDDRFVAALDLTDRGAMPMRAPETQGRRP